MTIRKVSSFEHNGITVKIRKRIAGYADQGREYTDYGYDAGMGVAAFGQLSPEAAEEKAKAVLDSMKRGK
jgi:hypothetical protein